MPAPLDPAKVQAVMRDLGVAPGELESLRRFPFEVARTKLEELKERVRKNYKKLAFELHPDRTGNDPASTERFKLIGTIKDEFEKLQFQPHPPMPQMQPMPMRRRVVMQPMVVHVVTWSSAGSTYTSTTANVTGFGVPFRVATMKPT